MSEISADRLMQIKSADQKGLRVKEIAKETALTEGQVKATRAKLRQQAEIPSRKSRLRGKDLDQKIAELRQNPDKSNSQIAQELGVAISTVKNSVVRNKNLERRNPGRKFQHLPVSEGLKSNLNTLLAPQAPKVKPTNSDHLQGLASTFNESRSRRKVDITKNKFTNRP